MHRRSPRGPPCGAACLCASQFDSSRVQELILGGVYNRRGLWEEGQLCFRCRKGKDHGHIETWRTATWVHPIYTTKRHFVNFQTFLRFCFAFRVLAALLTLPPPPPSL
jgi:hypothetical protein